jgi:hypothetical protein
MAFYTSAIKFILRNPVAGLLYIWQFLLVYVKTNRALF